MTPPGEVVLGVPAVRQSVVESTWVHGDGYLSEDLLEMARAAVPILCVDLVPVRSAPSGGQEVGLVLRDMPGQDDPVWCHLGGRVRRGETIRAALLRHLHSTLRGVSVALQDDPQPDRVVQWFPAVDQSEAGAMYGFDPRQHAVALVYVVTVPGTPDVVAEGEALDFRWWALDQLDELATWPGSVHTVRGALGS